MAQCQDIDGLTFPANGQTFLPADNDFILFEADLPLEELTFEVEFWQKTGKDWIPARSGIAENLQRIVNYKQFLGEVGIAIPADATADALEKTWGDWLQSWQQEVSKAMSSLPAKGKDGDDHFRIMAGVPTLIKWSDEHGCYLSTWRTEQK